ncbi:hypothetical protein [Duganella violaceipulchra]|uniref:Uncharacterized protein n=1 Tax=Duganella violaceipulchra TaxID=2849652 RepID=A0AA41L5F3_9BURK|nr:hypothetical protein [Duganella violaceicalia]MBV6322152.1 hypothetical protein [Duganella violaceicalia]MCP2011298.1 hypothetical protein [Duganella violaceicalia]
MNDYEIDIGEFGPMPLAVLRTALAHAQQNPEKQSHVLPLKDFYKLAGLSTDVSIASFLAAVGDARKASVCFSDDEAQTWISDYVFGRTAVTPARFEFVISANARDAVVFPTPLSVIRSGIADDH